MADTLVDGNVASDLGTRVSLWGVYWSDINNGVIIYVDNGLDLAKRITDDTGATWTKEVIFSGNVRNTACWYDKETPGDSGTLLHIAWLDSDTSNCYYRTVDLSDDTLGTERIIDSGITVSTSSTQNRIAITKAVNGNLIVAFSTQSEIECYRSVDSGANWTDRADPFEVANQEDWLLLFSADTGDNADVCGCFWDRSANEISLKMYDDSANTWTETLISGSMTDTQSFMNMDGCVKHSNNHIIFAAHSNDADASNDLMTWDLTVNSIASPTITAKTNIFTDQVASSQITIFVDQNNNDIYAAYLKGGSWQSTVDAVYHISTDGMTTWGSEQVYSEASADDIRLIQSGRTVGSVGGRYQPTFYNDDLKDIFVNLTNDVEITGGAVAEEINAIFIGSNF